MCLSCHLHFSACHVVQHSLLYFALGHTPCHESTEVISRPDASLRLDPLELMCPNLGFGCKVFCWRRLSTHMHHACMTRFVCCPCRLCTSSPSTHHGLHVHPFSAVCGLRAWVREGEPSGWPHAVVVLTLVCVPVGSGVSCLQSAPRNQIATKAQHANALAARWQLCHTAGACTC